MKTTIKILELLIWVPFIVLGALVEFMIMGFQGGRKAIQKLHSWLKDKEEN